MKKIHKSVLLLTLVVAMIFTVISVKPVTAYADDLSFSYEYDDIESSMEGIAQFFAAKSDAAIDYYIDNSVGMQLEAFKSFKEVKEQKIGSFVSIEKCNIKEDADNDSIEVTSIIHFEKKDVKMTATFKSIDDDVMPVEMSFGISAGDEEKNTSLASKMGKAALNTLMGMGTVIIVLAFLAVVISLFGVINNLQNKKKKEAPVIIDNTEPESTDEEVYEDDDELVAVIAAAIAASEGTTTDGFVVRSIKRSKNNKWKNA